MLERLKLSHLQYAFAKLTENNQFYVLGIAEGLKHAQGVKTERLNIQTPDGFIRGESVFDKQSSKRKNCP